MMRSPHSTRETWPQVGRCGSGELLWQKTVGSALLEALYSGRLIAGRVRLIVSVKESVPKIVLA